MKKIFKPDIQIIQNEFDEFHCINSSNTIKEENCKNCNKYNDCNIWKNKEFEQFYQKHEFCDYCKINPLEKGYLYVRWRINKSELQVKEYNEKIGYFCCFCAKKKGLKSMSKIEEILKK